MTRLWNDPADFADEMIDGFVAAHPRYVRRVTGGVVRATATPSGHVAVVIGGGSGHYPAFGGMVGMGLAHGAALGNLFASPSTQQIESVARAADRGAGVLFAYGNYAGDVLNFDAAERRLQADGIACASVAVTDDISSAPADRSHERRGIAGDLAVFRIAAAAAERGNDLDTVARLARLTNYRTRSFGVAFSGCTLPGAAAPLFTVPEGHMAVGLGIHGEPGIDLVDVPSADSLAELLVAQLLAERPTDADGCVVPILNGLGSAKYEELFVVFRRVAQLLTDAGLELVDPHVGEYCTSFDMAGLSLTLCWLDDELADLWEHPVDAPAYRRGSLPTPVAASRAESTASAPSTAAETSPAPVPESDAESRATAVTVVAAVEATAAIIDAHVDDLGRMDAVAGDGDHGIGMQRGARAAAAAARAALAVDAGAGTTLRHAADAWSDRAGGTSGALWGVMLTALAARLGDHGTPVPAQVAAGVSDAATAVTAYGKARVGDKTLVDALGPFDAALARGLADGASLSAAWHAAASVATDAAAATATLVARRGRARSHGDQSLGTPDPGAHSFALIATAVCAVLTAESEGSR